ncbi:MAG TPA: type II toxin-antitoxin system prevent-host-death family antitoxin [Candidatus Sulfotelmatobacter sp.]|nr:type II toxin-antitoxin system prevent-host-death family antitoxin [Candidatus Sulfotelmatobacter sp.]
MEDIDIAEFKRKCFAVIEQVRKTQKPICVTRDGKPIAQITPVPPPRPANWIGSMNQGRILGDIISPATPESDWEASRDEALKHPSQRRNRRR